MFLKKLTAATVLCYAGLAYGGFLEMPVIEEVPEAENDILLKDLDIPNVRELDPRAGERKGESAYEPRLARYLPPPYGALQCLLSARRERR